MAFTNTILQEGILSVRDVMGLGFKENELRRSRYGAIEAFRASTPRALPASTLMRLKEATAQVTSIDVFNKQAQGSGTARKCSGVGTGTTQNIDLVYNTFVEEFSISSVEHQNNRVTFQEAFNHHLQERMRSFYERWDSAKIAELEANKAAGGGAGTIFTTVLSDAKRVPLAEHDEFFNGSATEMEQNDFMGPFLNVSSTSQLQLQRFDAAQGGSNSTNLAFPFGDFDHFTSNRLTPGAGVKSTSFLFTPGTVACIPWINKLHREGRDIGTDIWTKMVDPFTGWDIELKVTKECKDNSGSFAGAEADYVESFVLSMELAIVTAHSSTTNTGIYKYELLST